MCDFPIVIFIVATFRSTLNTALSYTLLPSQTFQIHNENIYLLSVCVSVCAFLLTSFVHEQKFISKLERKTHSEPANDKSFLNYSNDNLGVRHASSFFPRRHYCCQMFCLVPFLSRLSTLAFVISVKVMLLCVGNCGCRCRFDILLLFFPFCTHVRSNGCLVFC